jgi:hypothetical protein
LPIYVVGVGRGWMSHYRMVDYIAPNQFENAFCCGTAFLAAHSAVNIGNTRPILDGPTDSISEGAIGHFSMFLTSETSFTLQDSIRSFAVVFSDEVVACYSSDPNGGLSQARPYAVIKLTSFSPDEVGFIATNQPDRQPSPRGSFLLPTSVTGTAFGVPADRSNFSLLSVEPQPQANGQKFKFAQQPSRLTMIPNFGVAEPDFGLLTGGNLQTGHAKYGIPPFEASSEFRIAGNFSDTRRSDVLRDVLIRFEDAWVTLDYECPTGVVGGGGVRGSSQRIHNKWRGRVASFC